MCDIFNLVTGYCSVIVNVSIGCIHKWCLSSEPYRQTICTLCGQCCEKGQNCPYNGLGGQYQHQCGCNTRVTGCTDCGICQNCGDLLWVSTSCGTFHIINLSGWIDLGFIYVSCIAVTAAYIQQQMFKWIWFIIISDVFILFLNGLNRVYNQ